MKFSVLLYRTGRFVFRDMYFDNYMCSDDGKSAGNSMHHSSLDAFTGKGSKHLINQCEITVEDGKMLSMLMTNEKPSIIANNSQSMAVNVMKFKIKPGCRGKMEDQMNKLQDVFNVCLCEFVRRVHVCSILTYILTYITTYLRTYI